MGGYIECSREDFFHFVRTSNKHSQHSELQQSTSVTYRDSSGEKVMGIIRTPDGGNSQHFVSEELLE